MNSRSLRTLVALVGVLGVVGLLASNSGFAGQTLANWNDRVFGSAKFDVPGAYGKGYARAVAAKYSMSRPVGSSVRSGLAATREPGQMPAYADVRFGNQNSTGGTLGLLLPVEIEGASCAVYASPVAVPCTNGRSAGASVVFAAAAARGLLVETTSGGIDLARFGSTDVVSTTASCPIGGSPVAGGINSIFGGVVLAGMGNTEKLPFPSDPGPNNSGSTRQTRSGFGYDYDAQLTWTKTRTSTSASSELRLEMTSTGKISKDEKWELDMVLAYAECGIGTDAPVRWAEVKPSISGLTAMTTTQQDVPSPIDSLFDEGVVGDAEKQPVTPGDDPVDPDGTKVDADGDLDERHENDNAAEPDSDPPVETGEIAPLPDDAPLEDDPAVAPIPTISPAPIPSGPTIPTRVGMSSPFPLVAKDGSDLGTVTVERISRTPGCVAVRLSVTTSDGSGYLKGLRESDFREVLADGGTASVGSPSGECDAGASLPATFDPESTYSGWVTFDVTNDGTGVMVRPDGTAGWIFSLPATETRSEPVVTTPPPVQADNAETTDSESGPATAEEDYSSTADE
ncbi:hypothetical protein [Rhodococcus sp. B50]|uniref:hypothetical protein n=1 Tax=Rhodococcus sp. B50 TaxID=2682847 RepID=UPI001BD6AF22|nr:hypothetical protein [Rhodococcus sp. B50]MBS9375581.1 hypothetical protein [Rhodococcus sp. B50]